MNSSRISMWQQVLARDPSAQFFYAVTSTGIFCRPSCPSRRPSIERVRFYPRAAEAVAAGYRPCRRCLPLGKGADVEMAALVCRHLAAHLDRAVHLGELGKLVQRSPFTVQRTFVRALGISPRQYQQQLRMNEFRESVLAGSNVTSAMHRAGYSSPSRLYDKAAKNLGMNPARFRNGGGDQAIHVAVSRCALGFVQVAATDRGLCSVMLGDTREELHKELERQYPGAEISAGGAEPYLEDVLHRIRGEAANLKALPRDVRATAFQARVWKELERIPRGETRSYAGVAQALGHPRAVRAVARACALNPIAVVVPCHRVIGSDGALTGYRWGVERKRKLLEMERNHS